MNNKIKSYAAFEPKGKFQKFEFEAGELGDEEVEIKVHSCGLCHSDLSMLNNEWAMTTYPFVGGHEAVGEVIGLGKMVKNLTIGDKVGLGWTAETCGFCRQCIAGNQIDCPSRISTIVGRHGGFADKVRCHWMWAVKLPDKIDIAKAGPLFCGGLTVFTPLVQLKIKPTDKVGVVGIGGLGHLALQFADKWGCEVTAFTTSPGKADEAKNLGADYVVDTRSDEELTKLAGKFDLIIDTINQPLNWNLYVKALGVEGKLHIVGAVLEPISVSSFALMSGQKSITGSGTGKPSVVATMLEFCARHNIEAVTENYKMSQINEAFERLESGKARYRIVLENDF